MPIYLQTWCSPCNPTLMLHSFRIMPWPAWLKISFVSQKVYRRSWDLWNHIRHPRLSQILLLTIILQATSSCPLKNCEQCLSAASVGATKSTNTPRRNFFFFLAVFATDRHTLGPPAQPESKPLIGRLVVGSVTTSESLPPYVFALVLPLVSHVHRRWL